MAEHHHNPHDGCEACVQAEKDCYFEGGFNLGVEWAVREYEALPAVKQARSDGTLVEHFPGLLGREPAKNGDARFFKALAVALEKTKGKSQFSE